jgi:hypothetical protein
MATGENTGTWGNVTNTNLGTALEEAITGNTDVTFSGSDVTLTLTNTNGAQTARNLRLNLTGTSGGARQLVVPSVEKVYIVRNGLADTVTVRTSGGAGVAIPTLKTMWVYSDGIDVLDVTTYLSSLALGSALPVASGGTGLTTPGTNGNVLTSNGSAWASTALPATFTAGMIMMWSGTIATIPSGWALCNGSSGTPDLRNKFIIGAYQDNAGAAVTTVTGSNTSTGGSKDAITVSHTHTFSATTSNAGSHNHLFYWSGGQGGNNWPDVDNTGGSSATSGPTSTAGAHEHTVSGTTDSTGSSGTNANLPPYYALAYIMKL